MPWAGSIDRVRNAGHGFVVSSDGEASKEWKCACCSVFGVAPWARALRLLRGYGYRPARTDYYITVSYHYTVNGQAYTITGELVRVRGQRVTIRTPKGVATYQGAELDEATAKRLSVPPSESPAVPRSSRAHTSSRAGHRSVVDTFTSKTAGLIILGLGCLVNVIGTLWLIVRVFRQSVVWGLFLIVGNVVAGLLFFLFYPHENIRGPLRTQVFGIVLVVIAIIILKS